jgi:hypothetical protein
MNQKSISVLIVSMLVCATAIGVMVGSPSTASALPSENNFTFEFINGGTEIRVISWLGTSPNAVIPSALSGLPVVCIGERAFYDNALYTSVSIPSSVTTIEAEAFRSCRALQSINIPDSVTSIRDSAFAECAVLSSATIGSGVATMGGYVFEDCTALTSVTFPASLTSIGNAPMRGCSALTAINVAADNPNYASVGGVLYNKSLTALLEYPGGGAAVFTIPNGVTTIGTSAFERCTALTSVTMPGGLVSIGEAAFQQCSGLPWPCF